MPGCTARLFMTEKDFQANHTESLQELLEPSTPEAIIPSIRTSPISTVEDPQRNKRPISLAECLALAMEKGRVGTDSIRVLSLNPAIAAADIEQNLSRFDVLLQSSMTWNKLETPTGLNPTDAVKQDTAQFNTSLLKPLATGGVAGITYTTPYNFSNVNPGFNPIYSPSLNFNFEQPLLRGYGVFINELLPAHPNSVLTPFNIPPGTGILLSRVIFNQSRADFERQVQDLAVSVEEAYWNLYGAYFTFYSREEALRLALKEWQAGKERFERNQMTVQAWPRSKSSTRPSAASVCRLWGTGPELRACWRPSASCAGPSACPQRMARRSSPAMSRPSRRSSPTGKVQ